MVGKKHRKVRCRSRFYCPPYRPLLATIDPLDGHVQISTPGATIRETFIKLSSINKESVKYPDESFTSACLGFYLLRDLVLLPGSKSSELTD